MEQLIRPASFAKVTNLTLTNANTEYSIALHPSVRRFLVRARQSVAFNVCYTPGESGTHYLEIRSGEVYDETELYGDITLYFQSSESATILEILQWIEK